MADRWSEMLGVPIERIEDERLKAILGEIAEAVTHTNDPGTLRVLGQVLKSLGDTARGMAFEASRSNW